MLVNPSGETFWKMDENYRERCWSCGEDISRGHSLTDDDELQVCEKCWKRVAVHWRILLTFLVRERSQGGAGLVDALAASLRRWDFLDQARSEN